MRALTFGLAALIVAMPLAPAQALDRANLRSGSSVRIHSGHHDGRHDRRGGDFRRDRRDHGGEIVWGDWGYSEWNGGRVWEADSYNDWWHDRPDRAFPRWVQNNQACERTWWSGSGWRC